MRLIQSLFCIIFYGIKNSLSYNTEVIIEEDFADYNGNCDHTQRVKKYFEHNQQMHFAWNFVD